MAIVLGLGCITCCFILPKNTYNMRERIYRYSTNGIGIKHHAPLPALTMSTLDTHAKRRVAILEAHPEIKRLMGPDPRTAALTTSLVGAQVALAVHLSTAPFWALFLAAYAWGAVAHHMLFLCVHEAAHHLVSTRTRRNEACAILANLPILLPFAGVFRGYHLEHHAAQGQRGRDTDLPTPAEVWLVHSSATCYADRCARKLAYLAVYLVVYAARPVLTAKDRPPLTRAALAGALVQLGFDAALLAAAGPRAVLYLALSTLLAGGLHPVAAHFQAEHTMQRAGIDTYSYYGCLNAVSLNVGYHNEHHDFPSVAWTRLPAVRAAAPEFYPPSRHTAWPALLARYVLCDELGPQARLVVN